MNYEFEHSGKVEKVEIVNPELKKPEFLKEIKPIEWPLPGDAHSDNPENTLLQRNLALFSGLERYPNNPNGSYTNLLAIVKRMYRGTELPSIDHSGLKIKTHNDLKSLSKWALNDNFSELNKATRKGYAAEIISVAKENLRNEMLGNDVRAYRADDLAEIYKVNDQLVDKVRVDGNNNIVEKIQTKFVGNNGKECIDYLLGSKNDKYFEPGAVDKIEIPKNFYDEALDSLKNRKEFYQKQVDQLKLDPGNADKLIKAQQQLEKCDQLLNGKLEKSITSMAEAEFASNHGKEYTAGIATGETLKAFWNDGKREGLQAAFIAGGISICKNGVEVVKGEIDPLSAIQNIAKETATAGISSFTICGVANGLQRSMQGASSALIKSLSKTGIVPIVVTGAVETLDDLHDYFDGTISGSELVYKAGENLSTSAGGAFAGMATSSAAVTGLAALGVTAGAIPVIAAGAVGIAGGMVGVAVASELYKTAVDFGTEGIQNLSKEISNLADQTMTLAQEVIPEHVNYLKDQINQFTKEFGIPVTLQ